jgi:hypothetical protein
MYEFIRKMGSDPDILISKFHSHKKVIYIIPIDLVTIS